MNYSPHYGEIRENLWGVFQRGRDEFREKKHWFTGGKEKIGEAGKFSAFLAIYDTVPDQAFAQTLCWCSIRTKRTAEVSGPKVRDFWSDLIADYQGSLLGPGWSEVRRVS